jgi:LAS superfamily LD-carboxypeptidase LdcB
MKKRRRLRKPIKIFLFLILLITISYGTIIIFKNIQNSNYNFFIPKVEDTKDEITKKLEELEYNKEEIKIIKKYVSSKNINYLIDNKINHILAYNLVNETYYIDEYLEKYLEYNNAHPNTSYKDLITIINTHIDKPFYEYHIKTDTTLGKFVMLNKYYYADKTYPNEEDLVTIDGKYHINGTQTKLNKECYEAFLKMFEAALDAGPEYAFKLKSAYRSYDTQVSTYNYWVSQDGKTVADTYSARAGNSEHQTGYAFDIRDYNYEEEDYSKTASFAWVSENAHKYGFIIRFPEGKEHITGYQYESWHYRYCGVECATYIFNNDITYEEYYEYFIKFNNPKNIAQ